MNEPKNIVAPGISVAMCTYNGSRYLPEQLKSISEQTRLPEEVVVCDDCSTDNTVAVIEAFAKSVPFKVRVSVNNGNLGVTRNFEQAIRQCTQDIVSLADQDDIWLPHKLNEIARAFEGAIQPAAVFSDAEIIDSGSRRLPAQLWETFYFSRVEQKRFTKGEAFDVLLRHPVVTGATLAFQRKFCELLLPIPEMIFHDYWISFLLAACGGFQMIPEVLMQYRRHEGQQVGPGSASLGLLGEAQISRRTGRQRYISEIQGLTLIRERLETCVAKFPPHPGAISSLQDKIDHRYKRASYPESKIQRIPVLFREITNCRYWRFSEGWKSVAKDLFL